MGADARLHIWPEQQLAKEWPSHPELFRQIKAQYVHVYANSLAGVMYWHIYEGSGMIDWREVGQDHEWNTREPMNEAQLTEFLKLRWLQANATVWEVWT
jgi:hypothetical protein